MNEDIKKENEIAEHDDFTSDLQEMTHTDIPVVEENEKTE